jgi:hypothetical protein
MRHDHQGSVSAYPDVALSISQWGVNQAEIRINRFDQGNRIIIGKRILNNSYVIVMP